MDQPDDDENDFGAMLQQLEKLNEKLGNITHTYTHRPQTIKTQMYEYQIDGLNRVIASNKWNMNPIIADEMGMGKSLQAVAYIDHIKNNE